MWYSFLRRDIVCCTATIDIDVCSDDIRRQCLVSLLTNMEISRHLPNAEGYHVLHSHDRHRRVQRQIRRQCLVSLLTNMEISRHLPNLCMLETLALIIFTKLSMKHLHIPATIQKIHECRNDSKAITTTTPITSVCRYSMLG